MRILSAASAPMRSLALAFPLVMLLPVARRLVAHALPVIALYGAPQRRSAVYKASREPRRLA